MGKDKKLDSKEEREPGKKGGKRIHKSQEKF